MAESSSQFDYFQLPMGLFPLMNDNEMSLLEPKKGMCNRSTCGNGADGQNQNLLFYQYKKVDVKPRR